MEGKQIQEIIDKRTNSERYKYFKWGDDYYNGQNTEIMNRQKKIYLEDYGMVNNPFMANHQIPSGYYQKIILQLIGYVLGNGTKLEIDDYFNEPFDTVLNQLGITARKKGEAWLYAYVDSGQLKFKEIQPENLYPVYDKYGMLTAVIKLGSDRLWLYDSETVKEYEVNKKNKKWEVKEEYGHFQTQQYYMGKLIGEENNSFNAIPFIPLFPNHEKLSDLVRIKALIDTYDIINSDFANNIDDMQDAFFTLKGYSANIEDLAEFMKQLKQLKVVPIDQDGSVEKHELNIPVEARKEFLDRLDKDIFKFSMSVDTTQMAGGSLTNVAIKSMYADLDLKADQFETEIRAFIKRLAQFLNSAIGLNMDETMLKLDRTMITNVDERLEKLTKLFGFLTDETILELLPLDIDIEKELERRSQTVRLGE